MTQEAQANWHLLSSDSPLPAQGKTSTLVVCSNKPTSTVTYQIIRARCANHQLRTEYFRSTNSLAAPVIKSVVATGYNSAQVSVATDPSANPDAPVAFYTITSSKGQSTNVYSWGELNLTIDSLDELTTYSFTVTATNADGTSRVSTPSDSVTTPKYVPPVAASAPAAPLAAPAFTLSSSSEIKSAGSAISGYSITHTGGLEVTYTLSPDISNTPGLSFNSSTGLISGTPTTEAAARTYTLTATNASGSASQTFSLTVSARVYSVGSTGPGGGIIFYVSEAGFNCGSTFSSTGSPTGGKCHYLEASPISGADAWDATITSTWSALSDSRTAFADARLSAIGSGFKNTLAIKDHNPTARNAAILAQAYQGPNSLSDWYLPSSDESVELFAQLQSELPGGMIVEQDPGYFIQVGGSDPDGLLSGEYWTSTENESPERVGGVNTYPWAWRLRNTIDHYSGKGSLWEETRKVPDPENFNKIRPIRAF